MRKVIAVPAALAALITPAFAVNLNDPQAAAVGGIPGWYDQANAYPNVVSFYVPPGAVPTAPEGGSNCTGTLINSRTILTASHCMISGTTGIGPAFSTQIIRFNPDANIPSQNDRAMSGAMANPAYNPENDDGSAANDIALVSLARPVTGVTPVTLIQPGQPVPPAGSLVRIVGFGSAGTGTQPDTVVDSRRRAAESTIGGYWMMGPQYGTAGEFGGLQIQFRDPTDPDRYNVFNQTGPVPQWQAQPGPGDSGGPLFLVMPDGSLLQIGTVVAGDNGYGATDSYTVIQEQYGWIQASNPLRSTTAVAGSFNWSDSAAWLDTLGRSEVPNNADGNFTGYGTLGKYFDVSLSNASQITVDISPTIDTLSVSNSAASLNILPGSTLTVVLGTEVSAGQMTVGGILDTGTLLLSGGLITGGGTINAPYGFAQTGGVVAPGTANALGTLTVNGAFTQTAGGTLAVRVDETGSDRLLVNGQANLAGTLALSLFKNAPAAGQTFSVVAAESINGGFSQISSTLPAFQWSTQTVGNAIVLTADVNYADDVPVSPQIAPETTQAATGAAQALNALADRLPTAALEQAAETVTIGNAVFPSTPALAVADLNTLNAGQLALALATLPPMGFYGETAFALQSSRLISRVLTDRLNELDSAPLPGSTFNVATRGATDAETASALAYAAPAKAQGSRQPSALAAVKAVPAVPPTPASAYGVFVAGSLMTSGGASDTAFTTSGVTAGIDYRATPNFTIGVALTYLSDQRSADNMSLDSQGYAPTLYGRWSSGRFFLDGYLGYAFNQTDTSRTVILGDEVLNATASPSSNQFLAGALAGMRLDAGSFVPSMTVTPFVGLDFTQIHVDGYSETGTGALAIALNSRDLNETRATAGFDLSWNVPLAQAVFTPRLKASITQRFGDLTDEAEAFFVAAPDLPFQISGPATSQTYGSLGAALALQGAAWSGLVSYQADMDGSGILDNSISAKLRYAF
ncbi:autotransporter domain-containing protein [Aquabacter sp. CN5-332]|uniref:autotransporter domain-containing protein n=1 Tax=Aquabacter sp. CN5-332 TaxID=3156608 RepID=UPI0032B374D4